MQLTERLALRFKKMREILEPLQNELTSSQVSYSTDPTHETELIRYLDKRFKKLNTLIVNFQKKFDSKKAEEIEISSYDEMRSIHEYIARLINKIKNDRCKKNPPTPHFTYLKQTAKDSLLLWLQHLKDYASLNQLLPEEIQADQKVIEQNELLQAQQKSADIDKHFHQALADIAMLAKNVQADISCFISYAWASDERPWEKWVQPFLEKLKSHLEKANIRVLMDIYDSCYGFNSYHHMNEIDNCHYIILIGTESLIDKFNKGVSAVCYELNRIRKKRQQDVLAKRFSVIPLIVSGNMATAMPTEYERFTVIEAFEGGGYVKTVKELLRKLYNYGPAHAAFNNCWQNITESAPPIFSSVNSSSSTPLNPNNNYPHFLPMNNTKINPTITQKLTTFYQDKQFSSVAKLFDNTTLPIENYYVNLSIIKEQEKKEHEKSTAEPVKEGKQEQQEYPISSLGEHLLLAKEPIELENIFTVIKTTTAPQIIDNNNNNYQPPLLATARVLIMGPAGIGKTTLSHYIVHQWSIGKLWRDRYDFVLRIPLRNLTKERYFADREYQLSEVVQRECFQDTLDERELIELDVMLKNNRQKILIVLDGYDEVTQLTPALANILQRLKNFPHVIITSRPQMIDHFATDARLEIIGFTEENSKRYIHTFFKDNPEKEKSLESYLNQQPMLKSLVQIPINLELICSVWHQDSLALQKSSGMPTLTSLYQTLTTWLFKRFLVRQKISSNQNGLDLTVKQVETNCSRLLECLETVAWQLMQSGTLYAHIEQLENWLVPDQTLSFDQQLSELRKNGLMRKAATDNSYYFIHLTFQEFFAARYMAKHFHTRGKLGEEIRSFFIENKFHPRWQIVWWFTAGLVREQPETLSAFLKMLMAPPRDLFVFRELPFLIYCLEQTELPKNNLIVQIILNDIKEKTINTFKRFNYIPKFRDTYKALQHAPNIIIQSNFLNTISMDSLQYALTFLAKHLNAKQTNNMVERLLETIRQGKDENDKEIAIYCLASITHLYIEENKINRIIEVLLPEIGRRDNFEDVHVRGAAIRTLVNYASHLSTDNILKAIEQLLLHCGGYLDNISNENIHGLRSFTSRIPINKVAIVLDYLLQKHSPNDYNGRQKISFWETVGNFAARIGSDKIALTLEAILQDCRSDKEYICYDALEALKNLTTTISIDKIILLLQVLPQKCSRNEDAIKSILLTALGNRFVLIPLDKRAIALETLLLNCYYEESNVRVCALKSLGEFATYVTSDKKAIVSDVLIKNCSHNNALISISALEAFIKFTPFLPVDKITIVLEILLGNCSSDTEDVRNTALEGLKKFAAFIPVAQIDIVLKTYLILYNSGKSNINTIRSVLSNFFASITNDKKIIALNIILSNCRSNKENDRKIALEILDAFADHIPPDKAGEALEAILPSLQSGKDEFKRIALNALEKFVALIPEDKITIILKILLSVCPSDNLLKIHYKSLVLGSLKNLATRIPSDQIITVLSTLFDILNKKYNCLSRYLPRIIDSNSKILVSRLFRTNLVSIIIEEWINNSQHLEILFGALFDEYEIFVFNPQQLIWFDSQNNQFQKIKIPPEKRQACLDAIKITVKEIYITKLNYSITSTTDLHKACEDNNLVSLQQALEASPHLIDQPNESGETPLMIAAKKGLTPLAAELLKKGSNSLLVNNNYFSTTFLASSANHSETVCLLLKNRPAWNLNDLEILMQHCQTYFEFKFESEHAALQHAVGLLTGVAHVLQTKAQNRKIYLAHLQSFGSTQKQNLEGMSPDDFFVLRIASYLELWREIQQGHYHEQLKYTDKKTGQSMTFTPTQIIAAIKKEILIAMEALKLAEDTAVGQSEAALQGVATNLMHKISQLKEGEEWIYQTGYTAATYGHCIYVAFHRHQDNIVVRVDNLFERDLKNFNIEKIPGQKGKAAKYKPFCAGVWPIQKIVNDTFRHYLLALFAAKSLPAHQALPKIYQKFPQMELAWVKNWPAKRVQIVDNCVVRSYMVGMHIRLSQPIFHCLIKLESTLLLDKGIHAIHTPQPISSPKPRLRGGETHNPSVEITINPPSHSELLQKLQKDLDLNSTAVYIGHDVEQALVGLAGITINQAGAQFRRRDNGHTYFKLRLNDDQTVKTLLDYYQTHFPGSIQKVQETNNNNWYEIDFDTGILYQKISPALKGAVKTSAIASSSTFFHPSNPASTSSSSSSPKQSAPENGVCLTM